MSVDFGSAERDECERACARLVAQYCQAADHDDCEGFVSVFAPDGVWIRPDGRTFAGHEELRRFFVGRPKDVVSRHVSANPLVDVHGDGTASGRSYTTVYRATGHTGSEPPVIAGPTALVEYEDDYVLTAEGWRIKRRTTKAVFAFKQPGA